MNTAQRFDEIQHMLEYLDDEEILIEYETRHRRRDAELEWSITLAGTVKYVATMRSTHAYLLGATDVAKHLKSTTDPIGR